MINNNQDNAFLRRTLSKLLPDAFFHPLWIHLVKNRANYSRDFIERLVHDLEREQLGDDLVDKCQTTFLCVYLHSRFGEHTAALAEIEQVWKLAETSALQQIARCAAWGACAICVRQANYREALDWLGRLQENLKNKHEWLLLDVLELFKQNLETPVQDTDELLSWLVHWGEWPHSEASDQSGGIHKIQEVAFPGVGIILHLLHRWNSFRASVKSRNRGNGFLELFSHWGIPGRRGEKSETKQTPEAKRSGVTSQVLPSARALLPRQGQLLAGVPNMPETLRGSPAAEQGGLHSLAVYYLGQFQVYQDEQLVENWPSRKALSIFKYLILEHPASVAKEILMDTFWPDSDPESARRNLHQAIYALRQILRGSQEAFHHIFFKNDCYSLNPDLETWIDYREFEKHIEAGQRLDREGHSEEAVEQYGMAEGLYQGDFLEEDLYEDWPVLQRERLLNSYFSLVDRLTELYFQTGLYTSVIHLCHKVLAKDRCYEAVHRKLMQCYAAQGQRHLAVRQYQSCIRVLREDLGIPPSRETVDLYHHIAARRGA